MDISQFVIEMEMHYKRGGVYHTMRNPDNDITSGNHHVINATYYVILNKFNYTHGLESALSKEASTFIEACRSPTGVFNRAPTKLDKEGHDDNLAITVTSNILNLSYAKEIFDYGNKWRYPKLHIYKSFYLPIPLKWYYDNITEDKLTLSSWHGRFQWLIAFYKLSNGKSISLLERLALNIYLESDSYNKDLTDTSGRILTWLVIQSIKGKDFDIDESITAWEKDIMSKYPGGMGQVFGIYHGTNHPFALIMEGKI